MATHFAHIRGRGEAVEGIRWRKNMVRNRDISEYIYCTMQQAPASTTDHSRPKQIRGSLRAPHPKDYALQKEQQITGKRQPDEKNENIVNGV